MAAVKASASITLSSVRDVTSTTRYYLLQSSTKTAPSKPTTNPPSGWTTTEPTYTSSSTNTLYTCDVTVFSDGTFAVSDVSKSSAYEAAKAAYNKAAAAASAASSAQSAADEAKKVSTNYIDYSEDEGLVVGDQTGTDIGGNVQLTADPAVNLRDGETILASFTPDGVKINTKKATYDGNIEFIGETKATSGTIAHGGYIDFHYNESTSDYTSRIIEDTKGLVNIIPGLKINGAEMTDFVFASSFNNALNQWSWIKFKGGIAICWTYRNTGKAAANGTAQYAVSYPFTFKEAPVVAVAANSSGSPNSYAGYVNTGTTAIDSYVHNSNSAAQTCVMYYIVIGRYS